MRNNTTRKWTEKVWTEAHARRVLDDRERSGLSIRAFAEREGLRPERLYWWTTRLAQRVRRGGNAGAAVASFVPAIVKVARPQTSQVGARPGPVVVIRIGASVAIEVADPKSVPPSWIAVVAAELGDACS